MLTRPTPAVVLLVWMLARLASAVVLLVWMLMRLASAVVLLVWTLMRPTSAIILPIVVGVSGLRQPCDGPDTTATGGCVSVEVTPLRKASR